MLGRQYPSRMTSQRKTHLSHDKYPYKIQFGQRSVPREKLWCPYLPKKTNIYMTMQMRYMMTGSFNKIMTRNTLRSNLEDFKLYLPVFLLYPLFTINFALLLKQSSAASESAHVRILDRKTIVFQSYDSRVLVVFQSYDDRVLVVFQSYNNRVKIVFWSYINRTLVVK